MTEQESPRLPEQRSARHAAPRTPVRIRLRGRALAMAAVPTALLMAAAYTPTTAAADPAVGKPCATAPDAPPVIAETPVPKSELPPPVPAPTGAPTGAATAAPSAPAPQTPATPATPPAAEPSTATPSAAVAQPVPALAPVSTVRTGIIDDIVGGINDLIHPGSSPSPAPAAAEVRPAVAPALPAAPAPSAGTPSSAPSPKASGRATAQPTTQSSAKPTAKSTTKAPAKSSAPATPSATATPSADPNCQVDISALKAAGSADNPILVPDQNWTLQTTRLALHGSRFMGVVEVRTPTTTKRVLKFVVDTVEIDNLDMSTLEGNGKTFHVKGGPGTTSTMRKGPVTMYVERLSGHLSGIIGLPIPIDLGEITLTPDTLPQWLYDLIGAFPIPLDMELKGVTAVQSGQFGGTLTIPGMRMFNDDAPYVGAK
ncbi:hypothetical protein ACWEQL_07850 [Kitasatospora sp. NPDC004240]